MLKNLIYFSPVPWSSFAQRPHAFVKWFHTTTHGDVLWIDPYPTRLPSISDFIFLRTHRPPRSTQMPLLIHPWLTIVRPPALPLEPLPGASIINCALWRKTLSAIQTFPMNASSLIGVGKPSELALRTLIKYPETFSLYDAMDDFPSFYTGLSRSAMRRREFLISERVSRILLSISVVPNRLQQYRTKIRIALNGCALDTLPPIPQSRNINKKPILGYIGTIASWFDWDLVVHIAKACPFAHIRLIGPIHTFPSKSLPKNIELLPVCDHAAAIQYMQGFSVGLIPFKRTRLTESVDPIKYYEYRALGLPVVSTRFGEMARREETPGIYFIDRKQTSTTVISSALASPLEIDASIIQAFRNENSWRSRFDAADLLPEFAERPCLAEKV